jgi:protein-L-isoaspartate(D-aspartate) O-methyltransferase
MTDLAMLRHLYAEEIRAVANVRSAALVRAFATVPRERFLGPGPWQIVAPVPPGGFPYRTTEDADPRHLYHNVLVAIDTTRRLNNGQPSFLAFCLDALDLQLGDHAVHIGCGVGYYTAIVAELVGPTGQVTAIELDPDLAARARENLIDLPHVVVIEGDGSQHDPGPSDAILVNAGATHPPSIWLDSLRPDGRLLVPLTVALDAIGHGRGGMLRIVRHPQGFAARFISEVGIFPCIGARDAELNKQLEAAFRRHTWESVQSLRRERHEPVETCWLHGEAFCLSTLSGVWGTNAP